jgi:hypothetical protein
MTVFPRALAGKTKMQAGCTRETHAMKDKIKENMEVVGFDGGHLGTVDGVAGDFIKLKALDGEHHKHHRYIELNLVNDVEGDKVRLCCDADVATVFEEKKAEG